MCVRNLYQPSHPLTSQARNHISLVVIDLISVVLVGFVAQRFYLIDGTPSFAHLGDGIVVGYVYDGLALDMLHRAPPFLPVLLVPNKEADEHAGVHLPDMYPAQLPRVAAVDLLLGVLVCTVVVRQGGPGIVRV